MTAADYGIILSSHFSDKKKNITTLPWGRGKGNLSNFG